MPTISFTLQQKTLTAGNPANSLAELLFDEQTTTTRRVGSMNLTYKGTDSDFAAASALALDAPGTLSF
jgi:hypothetical protein